MTPQPPQVNGHGAVDLGALRATEQEKARALIGALHQAGLICACGNRIRGTAIHYFTPMEGQIPTSQGPRAGVRVAAEACCSRVCERAVLLEAAALARRDQTGRIVWLDELRAEQAARN